MLIKMIFAVDIMGESNCFLDHAYICDPRMPKYKKTFLPGKSRFGRARGWSDLGIPKDAKT